MAFMRGVLAVCVGGAPLVAHGDFSRLSIFFHASLSNLRTSAADAPGLASRMRPRRAATLEGDMGRARTR
eukprot:7381067-Prymnesium_polylepis.2